ncbi:MAG: PD40 domain-containing protein [Chloroflexi bacterium]|nr:PD40 domain-containing protein [Chloroflexota bacterium]
MKARLLVRAASIFTMIAVSGLSAITPSGHTAVASTRDIRTAAQTANVAIPPAKLTPVRMPFVSDRSGNLYIYVMNEDGSQTNLTTHDTYDNSPSLSPDGSKIAFVTNRDGNKEIYVMHSDGSDLIRLTNTANNVRDEWPA